jgi:hypothetical protein
VREKDREVYRIRGLYGGTDGGEHLLRVDDQSPRERHQSLIKVLHRLRRASHRSHHQTQRIFVTYLRTGPDLSLGDDEALGACAARRIARRGSRSGSGGGGRN